MRPEFDTDAEMIAYNRGQIDRLTTVTAVALMIGFALLGFICGCVIGCTVRSLGMWIA